MLTECLKHQNHKLQNINNQCAISLKYTIVYEFDDKIYHFYDF
jgi:hypothetical protein